MRSPIRSVLRSASLVVAASVPALAQSTHTVPGQFATIQEAITASVVGDTVLVSPGIFLERLDFLGKNIAVRSAGGALLTTIDGGGLGTVLSFTGGEGLNAILSGFTITGGIGLGGNPGAMLCVGSSPTVRNCRFINNEGRGGGAGAIDCLSSASPSLFNCSFESNRGGDGDPTQRDGGAGAIRCLDGSVRVEDSSFTGNLGGVPELAPSDVCGGAGAILGRRSGSRVTVRRCTFTQNTGGSSGVSPESFGGAGAIQLVSSTRLILEDSTLQGNVGGAGPVSGSEGGAGAIGTSSNAEARIERSLFTGNAGGNGPATGYGYGGPGAMKTRGGHGGSLGVTVSDCEITQNSGGYGWSIPGGGAFGAGSGSAPVVERCTIVGNIGGPSNRPNDTRGGAGAFHCTGGTATVLDCLIEANQGGASRDGGGPGVVLASGGSAEPEFQRCTLRGNLGSAGGGDFEAGHGVLYASASAHPRFEACLIDGNRGGDGAASDGGTGGFQVRSSASITLVNSIVVRNVGGTSDGRAGDGGLNLDGSGTSSITNCTFTLNEGGLSTGNNHGIGGIRLDAGEVSNSIVWGNTGAGPRTDLRLSPTSADVKYSCVGQGVAGQGNFATDPRFVDAQSGNFRIDCGSPCRDTGTLSAAELPDLDFEGDNRVFGATVDVGAYEAQFGPIGQNTCIAGINSSGMAAGISADGGESLADDCFSLLADAVTGSGVFIYSDTPTQIPFGDGFRCVAGQVYRLPPVRPNNGTLFMQVAPQALAGSPSPGSTWHFQAWYRDRNSIGAGFNTSDAVSITFTP